MENTFEMEGAEGSIEYGEAEDLLPVREIEQESRTVLFVDDDPLVRRAVRRTLRDFELDLAPDAESALEMLAERSYGVVAADYGLPGMDGIQLLEEVRERWPETVRVLVTGHSDFEIAIKAINRGRLFRFITKPWNPNDFLQSIEEACAQYKLVRENLALTQLLERKNAELLRINEHLDSEVQRRTTDMLLGLLNALDLRDTETQWHSRRVALYARRVAAELGLPRSEQIAIERGSLLHDIGKIGVRDSILLKPGKLTEEEWAEMRRHTIYGYEMLKDIEYLGDARLVVRNHHERWDGKGYPDGLAGEEIYIGARIFAVIDTYDAMTSDRPYRKALPPEVAFEEIRRHRGTQFDPRCVDAFLEIPQAELDALKARAEDGSKDWAE